MLKKIFFFIFIFLFILKISLALEVSSCKSGLTEWTCETDKICICEISGRCNNGNLFVYKTNILTPLCLPEINNNRANIEWDQCQNPLEGEIKVVANCDEGQSLEAEINLVEYVSNTIPSPTTTSITTVPTTTSVVLDPCPYECCENEPGYLDKECEGSLICCPSTGGGECKQSCFSENGETSEKKRGSSFLIIIIIIVLIIIAGLVLYFMKVIKLPPKRNIYRL